MPEQGPDLNVHGATTLHINHRYVLDYAARTCAGKAEAAILDYGCGRAQAVLAGRARGLNIYGVEIFHQGDEARSQVAKTGLLGSIVREIKNGVIDFPDEHFDFVFSNQVMEHVADLDQVLKEIARVLKPGGACLHLFPSRDVWREGHCGIPFLHWFPKTSPMRYPYALFLRTIGLGKFKRIDHKAWVHRFLDYLDNFCFYRSRKTIFASLEKHFDFRLIEDDYLLVRLGESRLRFLAPLVQWPIIRPAAMEAFRKLGGMVILATRTKAQGDKNVSG